jgi:hypothetical protein
MHVGAGRGTGGVVLVSDCGIDPECRDKMALNFLLQSL